MTRAAPGEATLRLPFAVDLPAGWRQIDPTLTGSGQTAFAAVRDNLPGAVFTPTITLEVERAAAPPDFVSVADVTAGALAAHAAELVVLDRRLIDAPAPLGGPHGITQVLKLRMPGSDVELIQSQVHLGVALGAGGDTLVVQLTCTSTPDRTPDVAAEFEQFVASFRLRPTEQEGRDEP